MKEGIIRKLSVGKDFPDGAIHFVVGQSRKFGKDRYTIHEIKEYDELGITCYDIYLKDDHGLIKWKTFRNEVVAVEFLIDFE